MDDKSLEILDFPQIKHILADFTSFSVSRQLVLDLQPGTDHQRIETLLKQSAEARRLLLLEPNFSIGEVRDIRQQAKMASLGKMLDPMTLLEVQQTMAAFVQLRNRLKKVLTEFPLLWDIAAGLVEANGVIRDIDHCISPNGDVMDRASERLAHVRKQLRGLRQQLHQQLEEIIKTSHARKIIQDAVIMEREGRFVIPLKAEHRREIKGIVHDVSNTGETFFVEPLVAVELGNSITEALTQEKREIEAILSNLSAQVGSYETEVAASTELTAQIDLALAKARFARKFRAAEPIMVRPGDGGADSQPKAVLKLLEARHPLIGDNAVPLSVEIGRDFSVLVITGPNTGGKTVAMKTIGLFSAMAQSGMPVPASPDSQFPIFDNIFADIGDEQSIEQTLSSFSWHVGNIVRIINQATTRSLALLDELGTSTDPVEGAALAVSIMRYFLSKRILTVATSHFGEVKAFAHATAGVQNASMDFDPRTLAPTYHLTVGIPSSSNALAVATRLGLPQEIIDGAQELLPEGVRELERLLVSLRSNEQEITSLRLTLEKEREDAVRRSKELEVERKRVDSDVRRTIEEAREKLSLEAAELHRQIREAESELRKEKSRERLQQAKKTLETVHGDLKGKAWQTAGGEEKTDQGKSAVVVGDTVWVKEAGVQATVLSVSPARQDAELQAGGARFRVPLDRVEKLASAEESVAPAVIPLMPGIASRSVPRELDLRGKRADEVEPALDMYLNDATLAGLPEVRIIHGYGTGAVRQVVRELLATHPLVKSFRPGKREEGGDGATVVEVQV